MGVGGTQKRTRGEGHIEAQMWGLGRDSETQVVQQRGEVSKDEGVSDKKNDDMKLQVQILIEAEEDPERKALFREYFS